MIALLTSDSIIYIKKQLQGKVANLIKNAGFHEGNKTDIAELSNQQVFIGHLPHVGTEYCRLALNKSDKSNLHGSNIPNLHRNNDI